MSQKTKRLKCCAITVGLIGFVMAVICAFWVPIMDSFMESSIKGGAALTLANEKEWNGIPGNYAIDVAHKNYFYNCKNPDEVIYLGEAPLFEEFGPFIYAET